VKFNEYISVEEAKEKTTFDIDGVDKSQYDVSYESIEKHEAYRKDV
jgi:hypothetical protein